MTYTFKLARRLAVSRRLGLLPALMLFAACNGDTTAPESSPGDPPPAGTQTLDAVPVTVKINPPTVTAETNQLIRFLAQGRNSEGVTVTAPVTWSASGGTILADGRFSAAVAGTYTILGRTRHHGRTRVDSSRVVVVRRQPRLASITVTPASVSLNPGTTQTFLASGRLGNNQPVKVGVNWTAAGGTIDAGGGFVAGDTAGTYRVIAANTAGTIADTAIVTIGAPATPPPPPPGSPPPPTDTVPGTPGPTPAPKPTLQQVTLVPASATLAPSATRQFKAYGRLSNGDSTAVSVTYVAAGGAITTGGLYTAGQSAGAFRLIARSGTLADTSTITITAPLGSGDPTGRGIVIAPYDMAYADVANGASPHYNGVVRGYGPDLIAALPGMQARGAQVIINVSRSRIKDGNGLSAAAGIAEINSYNWAALKPYLGSVIAGVMTADDINAGEWKCALATCLARWDEINGAVEAHGAVPVMRARPGELSGHSWQHYVLSIAQYSKSKGEVNQYLSDNLANAQKLGIGVAFALNVIDGGDGSSGMLGTYATKDHWQMTGDEILKYGKVLLPHSSIFTVWRWAAAGGLPSTTPAEAVAGIRAFDTRPDVVAGFAALKAIADGLPRPKAGN
jgi:hypothetical protein